MKKNKYDKRRHKEVININAKERKLFIRAAAVEKINIQTKIKS